MAIRRAMILLMAITGVICCGAPMEPKEWTLERAELTRTIENLKQENLKYKEIVEKVQLPQITVDYFFKDQCVAFPYELKTGTHTYVIFKNNTTVDATFTIPNSIFSDSVFTVPGNSETTLALAPGASEHPTTDYALEAKCYKEPDPGPFIIVP